MDVQEVSGLRAFTSALKDRLASNGAAYIVLREQLNLYGGVACESIIHQTISHIVGK